MEPIMYLVFFVGLFCLGYWWRSRKADAAGLLKPDVEPTYRYLPPDHSYDRPAREFLSVSCPDPTCAARVDVPVRVTVNHRDGQAQITVRAEGDELSIHELTHDWS
jgi:hypothetical protein